MFKFLKKIDLMIPMIFFTICIGIIVIEMRSETYKIGYEIASLKYKEYHLNQRQIELRSELAITRKTIRDKLLSENDKFAKPKYILPDTQHVLREN